VTGSQWKSISELRGVRLPYGICHPTQVNTSRPQPQQVKAGTCRFTYPGRMEG